MDPVELGHIIRERRKDAGLTQQQLADEAGCGLVFVGQVERGKATAEVGKVLTLLAELGLDIEIRERPMSLPVLFLDIDGVLPPRRLQAKPGTDAGQQTTGARLLSAGSAATCAPELCAKRVARLNALLERTRARMVLLSTWRRVVGPREMRRILALQGLVDRWHEDAYAPWTGDKAKDVSAWLAAHSGQWRWAVLDSAALWPSDDPRSGQHIQPKTDAGPTAAQWAQLVAALKRDAPNR